MGRASAKAPGRAGRGATEYRDIVAADKYLQAGPMSIFAGRPLGGSYGGFLTAMASRVTLISSLPASISTRSTMAHDNWDGRTFLRVDKLAHESSPVTSRRNMESPVFSSTAMTIATSTSRKRSISSRACRSRRRYRATRFRMTCTISAASNWLAAYRATAISLTAI